MFGKKPEIKKPELELNVQTMPVDFYGGVNPVVRFKKVEKEVVLSKQPVLTATEKKLLDKATAAGSGSALHPANLLTNKKYAIIFGAGLFAVITAAVSIYYYFQLKPKLVQPALQPPALSVATSTPTVSGPDISITTSPSIITTTEALPAAPAAAALEFPSSLLGESADLDKDNITDVAEEIFGTDPSKPDTDEDSYNDGHEVFYLYNPAGKEPLKLIASGMVQEYANPFGYTIYYPNNWAVGTVDEASREVLFSTITGENIEIRTFDLDLNESFADWFARWAPNENYGELQDFDSRFFSGGKARSDGLVYYFVDKEHVYVFTYHTTDSNIVNYKSVLLMMARSFSFASPAQP